VLLDEVRRGHEVIITYRGKSVAVLAPVEKVDRAGLNPIGFGIWQNRKEMRSVERWLRNLRRPRHKR
jgi:antitoxin (DNA-binding transcriptional repressor) of toxin-antitoxin stability system